MQQTSTGVQDARNKEGNRSVMTLNHMCRKARSAGTMYFKLCSATMLVGALSMTFLAVPTLAQDPTAPTDPIDYRTIDYSDVWTPEKETRSWVRNCGSAEYPWPCDGRHPPLRPDLTPAPRAEKHFNPAIHPDFTGRWLMDQGGSYTDPTPLHGSGLHPSRDDSINPAPLNAEYQALYDATQTPEAIAARAAPSAGPRAGRCNPPKMPGAISALFTKEISMGDDRMFMITEYQTAVRRIYLDGRPHPSLDDFDPSWMGHSIGRFDGEFLIIDTTMITPENGISIQGAAAPATENLRIVERMRLIEGGNKIELMVTFFNPDVFTKPWTVRRTWTRQRSDFEVVEYECQTYDE